MQLDGVLRAIDFLLNINLGVPRDARARLRRLATHVVRVTLGYSATFLAGFLGIIYIFRGLLTKSFDETTAKSLGRMMYGIICFATCSVSSAQSLAVFGPINLGGVFGVGPKGNGALLIVIWNAIILHARWGLRARTWHRHHDGIW